jgi:hypothetical protein
MLDGLTGDLLRQFVDAVPRVATAIVILIIGIIIAKIVAGVIKRLLEKIQVDKLGDKLAEIDIVEKSNVRIKISKIISKFVYYILVLFFMIASADALGMPAISNLVSDIINFIPNLVVAIIMLILGLLVAEALKNIVHTALKSLGIPSANMIANFVFYFILITVFVSALRQAAIETNFLETNLSILIAGVVFAFAIGYGLASKDLLKNIISSFYNKGRLSVGDRISVDDVSGEIIEIDNTTVTIRSNDRRIVYPLSHVMGNKLTIHD